jgi:hypothetical protein
MPANTNKDKLELLLKERTQLQAKLEKDILHLKSVIKNVNIDRLWALFTEVPSDQELSKPESLKEYAVDIKKKHIENEIKHKKNEIEDPEIIKTDTALKLNTLRQELDGLKTNPKSTDDMKIESLNVKIKLIGLKQDLDELNQKLKSADPNLDKETLISKIDDTTKLIKTLRDDLFQISKEEHARTARPTSLNKPDEQPAVSNNKPQR